MKTDIYNIIIGLIKHPQAFKTFVKSIRNEEIFNNRKHILLAADWLLKAQKSTADNGYSRGFYLTKGWDKSYIETTGYIIPTLLKVSKYTNNDIYKKSALNAGEWLLNIQEDDGAYTDIDHGIKLVFDTGQVLYGLLALYNTNFLKKNKKIEYKQAIIRASNWLCEVQDEDGSWTKYGFNGIAHVYYSRVSAILYKVGLIFKTERFRYCATKHVEWVLSCQNKNGFFSQLNFSKNEPALLHSIIYVLEGLYDYYLSTKNETVLNSLLRNSEILKTINVNRDLLLCSQYNENFECINEERCITGLAQWSNLALKLYQLTNDTNYLNCAIKTIYYLKSKQFKTNKNLIGSLPGSVPFWGKYAPYSAINWGVKFFIDALLEYEKYKLSLIDESNLWIGECFKFNSNVVDSKFTATSKEYLKSLVPYVKQSKRILDLGCGEGKYLVYFEKQFPNKYINGIDPYFFDNEKIKKGNVYNIDFVSGFDLIYTIEVLQHVKYLDIALESIHKKLKNGGYFIICDRNPRSIIGYIKSLQEYRGKWMYPFDSPFIEKWYTLKVWRKILKKYGFKIEKIKTFNSNNGKFGCMNKYNIIILRKTND
jgi:SAM-dependent methyltransferase